MKCAQQGVVAHVVKIVKIVLVGQTSGNQLSKVAFMSFHDLCHAILNVLENIPCSNNAADVGVTIRHQFSALSL